MAAWSPTLEGFRTVFRRPSLPLAEVMWRWSFGAAAWVLLGFGFVEYLDTLPVSNIDLLFLRSRHPLLISQAIARILRGSGFRFVIATVVLFSALAVLWIVLASLGRAATLNPLLEYIRNRARQARAASDPQGALSVADAGSDVSRPRSFRSLAGLNFLRATLALAACASCVAALILAGFTSSKDDPRPGLVFFAAFVIVLLVWLAWSSVSWFLSLASIFVVRQGEDTFAALSSAVGLCRDRSGAVAAVGTWFGLIHIVLFVVATSVVAFPLSFARVLPIGLVLLAVLALTLLYFAIVDTLHVARLAGYVAILEAPPPPPVPPQVSSVEVQPVSAQFSAFSSESAAAMVDQDETILSDTVPPESDTVS
jgi:hypothetical protein